MSKSQPKTIYTRIQNYLSRRKNPATTNEVVTALAKADVKGSSVRRALTEMAEAGKVARQGVQKRQMTWLNS